MFPPKRIASLCALLVFLAPTLLPAVDVPSPAPWMPDLGDGTYRNPVLIADYSDPDAVRVGDDFYLVSSSFLAAPGLPILHSKAQLEQATLTSIGFVLLRLLTEDRFHPSDISIP